MKDGKNVTRAVGNSRSQGRVFEQLGTLRLKALMFTPCTYIHKLAGFLLTRKFLTDCEAFRVSLLKILDNIKLSAFSFFHLKHAEKCCLGRFEGISVKFLCHL